MWKNLKPFDNLFLMILFSYELLFYYISYEVSKIIKSKNIKILITLSY